MPHASNYILKSITNIAIVLRIITKAFEIFTITIRTSGTITARLALLTFFAEVLFSFFSTMATFGQVSRTTNTVTTSSAQGLVTIIRYRVFTTT